ncbi:Serine/threonine-protein kinase ksg1 [Tolypocladium paradoxum]|uniref:non-specific serine/threonine protein kinase n=1 Tax=Tolypocladium paradoxum TaxID=94208 RepID=A0A2S4KXU9_9HYPO|nr:Serine/threonine-protein kinase ksg1 [Tolypocladium paradoxum]
MNGDLSLSQALGGLRIANPDDAAEASSHAPPPASNPYPDAATAAAAAPPAHVEASVDAESNLLGPDMQHLLYHDGPEAGRPRSSVYSPVLACDSSASARPSREHSQRDGQRGLVSPGSGSSLPPRGSSRGLRGGGYASASASASASATPASQSAAASFAGDAPVPATSEDWKDRGAAVGVRREVDASGRAIVRQVKKGVRDFSFGRVLGEGSYSTVYLATDRQTLKEYAIKVLEKRHIIKEKKIKYVNIEKNTLNRLTEHPGIVRLYYTFQDETSLYYVLDLCNGGELLGVLKKTGQEDGRAASFVGTAEYVSPELLTHKNACKASDLWAFGCIIYQLLAGRPPFKAGSEYLTFQKIVNLEYEFPPGFPPSARDLVERCLVLDPARRLTIEHIKNHEFFQGQQFGKALWRTKAPRLQPYVPPTQEPNIIQLNGFSPGAAPSPSNTTASRPPLSHPQATTPSGNGRPSRIITELPPPTQLDIEWSPVLTRNNERILKLGDLMVISSPLPNGIHGKGSDEGHKKLSRFFGGSTTKKRQRLVMVTSSGRIVLAPAGGGRSGQNRSSRFSRQIALGEANKTPRGSLCGGGHHYTFEETKASASSESGRTADEWIDCLEKARDLAISQNAASQGDDNSFADIPSTMSSPASTLGNRAAYPEAYGVSDRSTRNHLSKSHGGHDDVGPKRNRFSKRQSRSGLGSAF